MMRTAGNNRPALVALAMLICTGASVFAGPTNAPVVPPPIPLVPSPVSVVRELLAETPSKRAETLSMYPEGLREPLEAKINEYLRLPVEMRELRLHATDLRHYLLQLMPLDPAARDAALPQVPEPMRTAVSNRLETWQILLPSMQEELIENEQVVRYFTQLGITSEEQRAGLLDVTPPAERAQMKDKIARWNALPEDTRKRVFAQFNDFFDLTPAEQTKALGTLSEAEREAMQQTLVSFAGLTPQQRMVCIRSFEKFSRMNAAERQQFLRKAEAWERMTPSERSQWRELVERVPILPPLPPGMLPQLVLPPVPSRPDNSSAAPPGTNGG